MTDTSVKHILKDCFEVGYWLGKAGAHDKDGNYLRQRELTVDS